MANELTKRLAVLAVVVLTAACPGPVDPDPAGEGEQPGTVAAPATAAEFCDTLYGTFARRYAECAKAAPAWAEQFIDKAKLCINVVKASQAGVAAYDGPRAGRCVAAFGAASCTALQAVLDESALPEDCIGAVRGTRTVTQACHADEECASGRCSATGGDSCPGGCYTAMGVGQSCVETRDCQPGLHCYYGTLWPTRTCQPLANHPGEGQPCYTTVGCSPGNYCRTSSFGATSGTCRALATSGTCASSDRLAPGYGCAGGGVVALLGPAAACASGGAPCGPGLYCGPDGTCQQLKGVGEPCVQADGKYAGCIGGTCDAVSGSCVEQSPSVCFTDWDCAPDAVCSGQSCISACRIP